MPNFENLSESGPEKKRIPEGMREYFEEELLEIEKEGRQDKAPIPATDSSRKWIEGILRDIDNGDDVSARAYFDNEIDMYQGLLNYEKDLKQEAKYFGSTISKDSVTKMSRALQEAKDLKENFFGKD